MDSPGETDEAINNSSVDLSDHQNPPDDPYPCSQDISSALTAQLWEMALPAEKDLTYKDLAQAVHKFAARIHTKKRGAAQEFAIKYSRPREDDEGTFAIFGDGSASGSIPAELAKIRSRGSKCKVRDDVKKWVSAGIAYKKHSNDRGWQVSGFPAPFLWTNNDGELYAIKRGLLVFESLHGSNKAMATLLLFSDAKVVLEMIEALRHELRLPRISLTLLLEILELIIKLEKEHGKQIDLHWLPGHKGIEGNELADMAAKLARPDRLWPEMYPVVGSTGEQKESANRARRGASEMSRMVQHQQETQDECQGAAQDDIHLEWDPDKPMPSFQSFGYWRAGGDDDETDNLSYGRDTSRGMPLEYIKRKELRISYAPSPN